MFGTNERVEAAVAAGRLAHDLVARLHRVAVPALRERRADVPAVFQHVLDRALASSGIRGAEVPRQLDAATVERLCLHDYREGNVRELENLAAVICARVLQGEPADRAVPAALEDCAPTERAAEAGPSEAASPSAYERHRSEITAAFHEVDGSLSRLEELLRSRGFSFNRRWLSVFLERWGVRRKRARRRE
ncbi:MAG: hypothetical protein HY905_27465 [Deltaproteobacteria bacterium]|nr:hypothetical protein [Deltaproteobacteria bacterium]